MLFQTKMQEFISTKIRTQSGTLHLYRADFAVTPDEKVDFHLVINHEKASMIKCNISQKGNMYPVQKYTKGHNI